MHHSLEFINADAIFQYKHDSSRLPRIKVKQIYTLSGDLKCFIGTNFKYWLFIVVRWLMAGLKDKISSHRYFSSIVIVLCQIFMCQRVYAPFLPQHLHLLRWKADIDEFLIQPRSLNKHFWATHLDLEYRKSTNQILFYDKYIFLKSWSTELNLVTCWLSQIIVVGLGFS